MTIEANKIIPYNHVLYNNCLYNVLLTALSTMGVSDKAFLINDFFTYKLNDQNDQFIIDRDTIKVKSDLRVLEELEISYVDGRDEDWNSFISMHVGVNPILVCIDQFFYPCSKFYKTTHSVYHMLIYGRQNSMFLAVALQDETCSKMEIQQTELFEGLVGKRKYFPKYNPEFELLALFHEGGKNDHNENECKERLRNNFLKMNNELKSRNTLLRTAAVYYNKFDLTSLHTTNIQEYVHPITHMIISKKVQVYQNSVLIHSAELNQILLNSLGTMRIILSIFVKLQVYFRLQRSPELLSRQLNDQLKKMADYEDEYLAYLQLCCK